MTRAQRIAVRVQVRVSPIKTPRAPQQRPLEFVESVFRDIYCAPVLSCFPGCYEAMDDVDDIASYQSPDRNRIADAPMIVVRGNYGLPCS